jgi:hypothetical protein
MPGSKWCPYTENMLVRDFDYENLHPNEEPFWIVRSPNESDIDTVFIIDSTAMRALHEQIGKELAAWDEHLKKVDS